MSLFFLLHNYIYCSDSNTRLNLSSSDYNSQSSLLNNLLSTATRAYGIRYDTETKLSVFGLTNNNLENIEPCYEEKKTQLNYEAWETINIKNSEEFKKNILSISSNKANYDTIKQEYLHRVRLYAEVALEILEKQGPNEIGDRRSGHTVLRIQKMITKWSALYGNNIIDLSLNNQLELIKKNLETLTQKVIDQ